MSRESDFQSSLIQKLKNLFPGCLVMKLDANYIQGIPDLLVLYKNKWAVLECKKSEHEALTRPRPNQPYYVDILNKMSYASFIYPENEEAVLNDLQRTFKSRRTARVSEC